LAINTKEYSNTKFSGVKIHKNNIDFYINFKIGSTRYRRIFKANSAHTRSDRIKLAYQFREKEISKIKRLQGLETDGDATVDDYYKKLSKSRNWSKEVRDGYDSYYKRRIKPIIGQKRISDVKPIHINAIKDSTVGLAPRTRKKAFEILTPLFNLAVDDEVILKSPIMAKHKISRDQKKEKKIIINAVEKYKTVYQTIIEEYADQPYYRAMLLFGFYGRRKGEVLNLRWEDIDFKSKTYVIRAENSKVGIDMTFSLGDDLITALNAFEDHKGEVFKTKNVKNIVKKIREKSGIPDFTYHWMRNLSVSALSAMGVELVHLSGLLGHTDLRTVKQYLSLQREESSKVALNVSDKLLSI